MAGPQHHCPSCEGPTDARIVRVTMWTHKGLVVIEDVPARVCEACTEQVFDEDVGTEIGRLLHEGFPQSRVHRQIKVPVFALTPPGG